MVAMAEAIDQGRDPRMVGEALLGALRDAFLVTVGAPAGHLSDADRQQAADLGSAIGAAGLTRALETLGTALVDMRQAADPRIPIEVALVRICDPSTDSSVAALVERVADLERAVARGVAAPGAEAEPAASPRPLEPPAGAPARGSGGQPSPKPAAAAAPDIPPPPRARRADPAPEPERTAAPQPEPAPAASTGDLPTLDELTAAMTDGVLARLKGVAKAIYTAGRFVDVRDGAAVFALANAPTRDRAERVRADVEAALAQQFGRPVPLTLVDESGAGPSGGGRARPAQRQAAPAEAPPRAPDPAPSSGPEHDEAVDVSQLRDANDVAATGVERLTKAFPGAEVVEEEAH
jgi:DNA polymerase-3 subunit gamma/tau